MSQLSLRDYDQAVRALVESVVISSYTDADYVPVRFAHAQAEAVAALQEGDPSISPPLFVVARYDLEHALNRRHAGVRVTQGRKGSAVDVEDAWPAYVPKPPVTAGYRVHLTEDGHRPIDLLYQITCWAKSKSQLMEMDDWLLFYLSQDATLTIDGGGYDLFAEDYEALVDETERRFQSVHSFRLPTEVPEPIFEAPTVTQPLEVDASQL